jgi:DNA-binding MarR family transcriptional regulator
MNDHDTILIALRRITRAIDLQSKRLMKQTGLTAPQVIIIQLLCRDGEMSAGAIARSISLSQATVTSIVERLERTGLVIRRKGDVDRRQVLVALTQEGRTRAETAPEPLQAGFTKAFDGLPSWEQHMLIAAVERIAELMDADELEASPFLQTGEIDVAAPPTQRASS